MTNRFRAALALLAAAALATACGSDEVDPTTQAAAPTAPLTAAPATTAPPSGAVSYTHLTLPTN